MEAIKNIIYRLARLIPGFFRSNRLLIVRLDAIGDYILFRNGLQALKTSNRFSKYKYTLLGNRLWKDLAESLDADVIADFIWIDPNILYNRNIFNYERLKLLIKLKFRGFQVVIHPVHSRILGVDLFIADLKIPISIGSSGDATNFQENEKVLADKTYNELIPVPGYSTFEFLRTQDFFSRLTSIDSSEIVLEIKNHELQNKELTITIAPGAGHLQRRWPPERFAEIIRGIHSKNPNVIFYLCGSSVDMEVATIIQNNTSGCRVENYCGELSLTEFVNTIKKSSMLIANESSAVHIAAALSIPAICISNGNMFGRFNPYPAALNRPVHTIYPNPSFLDPAMFENLVEKTRVQSEFDISKITSSEVLEKCFTVIDSIQHSVKH